MCNKQLNVVRCLRRQAPKGRQAHLRRDYGHEDRLRHSIVSNILGRRFMTSISKITKFMTSISKITTNMPNFRKTILIMQVLAKNINGPAPLCIDACPTGSTLRDLVHDSRVLSGKRFMTSKITNFMHIMPNDSGKTRNRARKTNLTITNITKYLALATNTNGPALVAGVLATIGLRTSPPIDTGITT